MNDRALAAEAPLFALHWILSSCCGVVCVSGAVIGSSILQAVVLGGKKRLLAGVCCRRLAASVAVISRVSSVSFR